MMLGGSLADPQPKAPATMVFPDEDSDSYPYSLGGAFRQICLPVAGLYLATSPLVTAYRALPAGTGATTFRTRQSPVAGGVVMPRRWMTLVTAAGLSVFSNRLARLCAAVAFVSYQPGKPGPLFAAARLGEAPTAINDAVSAAMVKVLVSMIFLPNSASPLVRSAGRPLVILGHGR